MPVAQLVAIADYDAESIKLVVLKRIEDQVKELWLQIIQLYHHEFHVFFICAELFFLILLLSLVFDVIQYLSELILRSHRFHALLHILFKQRDVVNDLLDDDVFCILISLSLNH